VCHKASFLQNVLSISDTDFAFVDLLTSS
jgi:hypothetical protein